jgi:hypothetical protein
MTMIMYEQILPILQSVDIDLQLINSKYSEQDNLSMVYVTVGPRPTYCANVH